MFKSDDNHSSGDEVARNALRSGYAAENEEYGDILTDDCDDVPHTEKFKVNFNPLEVMSEIFYQVTNFNPEIPQSSLTTGKNYSFKRKNLPSAPTLEYLKTKRSKYQAAI